MKRNISGSLNPNWKGGRRMDKDGYILILKRDHPYADSYHGYVREHRLVMEEKIGRYLLPTEVVHHKNGIKNDNKISNLVLLQNSSVHSKIERKAGTYDFFTKHRNFRCKCGNEKHYGRGFCKRCYNREYWRPNNRDKIKGYNTKSYAKIRKRFS